MNKNEIIQIINKLYKKINSTKISVNYRELHNIKDNSFTYGEIEVEEFLKILDLVDFRRDSIFYDLGSGSGKAVISAYLYKNPQKAIGIEYIPDLVNISKQVLLKLKEILKSDVPIEFINDDIKNYDFTDGNIIFAHATCFSEELLKSIFEKIKKLKPNSYIIIVTKELKADFLKLLFQKEFRFSWGYGLVRIYEKI